MKNTRVWQAHVELTAGLSLLERTCCSAGGSAVTELVAVPPLGSDTATKMSPHPPLLVPTNSDRAGAPGLVIWAQYPSSALKLPAGRT